MHEELQPRYLLAGDVATPWQNLADPLDVNGDDNVTALDALLIANQLDRGSTSHLDVSSSAAGCAGLHLDANGDGSLTGQDFESVVTHLNGPARRPHAGQDDRTRFAHETPARRRGAAVRFADDLVFAIDVGAGLGREFQLTPRGGQDRAQAMHRPLDAGSTRSVVNPSAGPELRSERATGRIQRAAKRLFGQEFANANAEVLRSFPLIDELAEAMVTGGLTSVRAGRVAPSHVAAGTVVSAGEPLVTSLWAEGEDPNNPPTAQDEYYDLPHDTMLDEYAPGVMWNDWDEPGDALSTTLVSGPSHAASFTLYADGSFSYEPDPSWVGSPAAHSASAWP